MPATMTSPASAAKTILAACPHDCPDTCSMIVTVENDRVVQGARQSRASVHRRPPVRESEPLRRARAPPRPCALSTSAKRAERHRPNSTRITWDAGAARDRSRAGSRSSQEHGPDRDPALQLSGHRGHPQWHERGRSVLQQARRDCHRAHVLRLGGLYRVHHDRRTVARYRPRELRSLALHHSVGVQVTISTNLHHWPFIAEAQKRGAKIVVRRSSKDPHGTPSRLAHPDQARHGRRARDGDDECHHRRRPEPTSDYIEKHTVGFDELAPARRRVSARESRGRSRASRPRTSAKLAREYATHAKPSVIRIGVAVERHSGGGQTSARRSPACRRWSDAWRDVGRRASCNCRSGPSP